MAKLSSPRKGSLQFWPRKRAEKQIPSVNWSAVKGKENSSGVLGFIAYKVGMGTAIIKDNTEHSMTKGKKIFIPVTILEAPNMKIYSIRFYKSGKVIKDIVVSSDKELKRILNPPKELKPLDSQIPNDYEDVRIIVYSLSKTTGIKKSPDIIEMAFTGNKLELAKSLLNKEILVKDFLGNYGLLDVRALTKGQGLSGPVKRFGITLKQHKTEKGVRRPGSLGPWHPARVTFRTPQAGQLGMFSRVHYNLNVVFFGSISEKDINPKQGFKHYGKIKTNFFLVKGSVQGPVKRQVLVTPSFRPTKYLSKKKYEFQELII